MAQSSRNAAMFRAVIVIVVMLDIITKQVALSALTAAPEPVSVVGDVVRLSLVFNRGAAFGLHVGEYSRWVFLVLTVVALVILGRLYRATRPDDRMRTLALALVCGGAIGNLIDRIKWDRGVIDFIDIGLGTMRWPTFNVADMAVSTGAVLLAWVLWGEDRRAAAAERSANTDQGTVAAAAATGFAEDPREAR